jgi:hypothetical protein
MKAKHMNRYIIIGAVTAVLLPACALEGEPSNESVEEQVPQGKLTIPDLAEPGPDHTPAPEADATSELTSGDDELSVESVDFPKDTAGGSCTFGCSETHNTSNLGVLAGRNWGNPYGQTLWISPGGKTPQKQDWDAFRVDAGWCYHVLWYTYGIPDHSTNYNQIGRGEVWIQVHNYQTAVVQRQSTSSC